MASPADIVDMPSAADLNRLSALIESQIGLHFPEQRFRDLIKGIRSASVLLGFDSLESCVRQMLSHALTREQIQIVASQLTIGETYFMREKATLDVLEHHILPELIRNRAGRKQKIKLWSAGCSTGEEAYTLAVIIDKLLPNRRGWDVGILATDANVNSLEKARAGVYREWSFRGTPKSFRERYFHSADQQSYAIVPKIRQLVKFSYLNLVDDAFPALANDTHDVDVIFCRNVLMYFRPQVVQALADKFHNCLEDGGWLAVSLCETSTELYRRFTGVSFTGATLYKKQAKPAPEAVQTPATQDIKANVQDILDALIAAPAPAPAAKAAPQPRPRLATPAPAVTLEQALKQATALYDRRDYVQAARALDKALDPSSGRQPAGAAKAQAFELAARCQANLGELDKARHWCEQAVAADGVNPKTRYLLATILMAQGKTPEAKKALQSVLFLDPGFVLAHFSLGNLAFHAKDTPSAKRHLQNTLALIASLGDDTVFEDSGDMTVGQLTGIISSMLGGIDR